VDQGIKGVRGSGSGSGWGSGFRPALARFARAGRFEGWRLYRLSAGRDCYLGAAIWVSASLGHGLVCGERGEHTSLRPRPRWHPGACQGDGGTSHRPLQFRLPHYRQLTLWVSPPAPCRIVPNNRPLESLQSTENTRSNSMCCAVSKAVGYETGRHSGSALRTGPLPLRKSSSRMIP